MLTAVKIINEQDAFSDDGDLEEQQYELYGLRHSEPSSFASSLFSKSEAGLIADNSGRRLLQDQVMGIEQTIDRLYRLSVFIRGSSSSLKKNPKADEYVMKNEEGNDIGPDFKDYISKVIRHQYPQISKSLQARLSEGVVSRRRRFLWRQRHQRKLDPKGLVGSHTSRTIQLSVIPARISMVSPHDSQKGAIQSAEPTIRPPQSTILSVTTATQLSHGKLKRGVDLDAASTVWTTFGGESVDASLIIPPPPKLPPGTKEFMCPYCCLPLDIEDIDPKKWRRHILNDIEPYVCLFDGCAEGGTLFRHKHSWLVHLQSHQLYWVCTHQSHEPSTFGSEGEFGEHLQQNHSGTFTKAQIPLLKQRGQRRPYCPLKFCPFCFDPAFSGLSESSNVHGSPAVDGLLNHVQGHLQGIAAMSLPWLDDVDEASSGRSSTNAAPGWSSEMDALDVALDFQDIGMDSRPGDETYDVEPSLSTQENSHSQEWTFLSYRAYSGHERDPVLQPFLRKLYLGLSPGSNSLHGPRLPCYALPTDNPQFFGRERILQDLVKGLCPSTGTESQFEPTLQVYALCGPGGVGKTSVASAFVHQQHARFDAVLWVHGDSRAKLLQDFRDFAVQLGLIAEDSVDAQDQVLARDLVKRWLINPRKSAATDSASPTSSARRRPWLVVFDGIDDPELLNNSWPYGGPGSILITSRDSQSFHNTFNLAPLGTDEAAHLLLHLTGRNEDDPEMRHAQAAAQLVGGIPLVLTQMAGMVAQKQWSFTDFLKGYNERAVMDEASPQLIHKHTLASVWALENLKCGRGLLSVLSMLDPDGIPEQLLIAHMSSAELEDYPRDMTAFHQAKHELLSSSLIKEDKDTNELSLHRVCQDVARMQMDASDYRSTFFDCVKLIHDAWPYEVLNSWRHSTERWAACAKLFPHISRLLELVRKYEDQDIIGHEDYEFAKLLTDAGWYNHERGHSAESARFSDQAYIILQCLQAQRTDDAHGHHRGPEVVSQETIDSAIAEIYHNKGCFATETNKPAEALECLTQFNQMMRKRLGDDLVPTDIRLAISWNELGNAYMLNKMWEQGKSCFEESIVAIGKYEGFNRVQLSLPLVNVGLAFWITDRVEEAAEVLQKALAEREAASGLVDDNDSFM